ncbi:hypothetical protein F2Q69_00036907 [Brassica cretica]|uniref:Uncharacterized protein n=1 Tax=Brassica cretica TaxID=69181 RepID=A0A8S9SAZ0_BRACR|nr:hypothetical protein F2Q69_00036907 [Brassica cretica]
MASSQVFLSDLKSGCFVSGRRGMLGAELMSVDMLLLDSKLKTSSATWLLISQRVVDRNMSMAMSVTICELSRIVSKDRIYYATVLTSKHSSLEKKKKEET